MRSLLLLLVGCAQALPQALPEPSSLEWTFRRGAFAELSRRVRGEARSGTAHVVIVSPWGAFEGRGAYALDPNRGLRTIVLGPAGATVLDVWVTPEAWRLALGLGGEIRRGGAADPVPMVSFFRAWLLLGRGQVLSARTRIDGARVYVAKTENVVTEWWQPASLFCEGFHEDAVAVRFFGTRAESMCVSLSERGRRITYQAGSTQVSLSVLSEEPGCPPEALQDPDA